MKLIKEITEKDIGEDGNINDMYYKIRKAARAVIFNNKDEVAILHVSKHNYHKLPGGGIEKDETVLNALNREILEETGCEANITGSIGVVLEYRNKFEQMQISYCYLGKLVKIMNHPSFTEKELREGFKLKWMSLNDAIQALKNDKPDTYEGKFIYLRDIAFLSAIKI